MSEPETRLRTFLELAQICERKQQVLLRDRFLVIAATAAATMEKWNIADSCRQKVLQSNPGHLLRNFATMRDAVASPDFLTYLNQLQRNYPLEKAEFLLERNRASRAVDPGGRSDTDDFAAEMLGGRPAERSDAHSQPPEGSRFDAAPRKGQEAKQVAGPRAGNRHATLDSAKQQPESESARRRAEKSSAVAVWLVVGFVTAVGLGVVFVKFVLPLFVGN